MSYHSLYLKYKTKYINLKNQYNQYGGTDGPSDTQKYIDRFILEQDKEIAKKAIANLKINTTGITVPVKDKEELSTLNFNADEVFLFIYSFLVEYGFNDRKVVIKGQKNVQINKWIEEGFSLHSIIVLLFKMGGIDNRSRRASYAAILVNNNFGITNDIFFNNLTNFVTNFSKYKIILPGIKEDKDKFVDYTPKDVIGIVALFDYLLPSFINDRVKTWYTNLELEKDATGTLIDKFIKKDKKGNLIKDKNGNLIKDIDGYIKDWINEHKEDYDEVF
jgi:hypothetical protein